LISKNLALFSIIFVLILSACSTSPKTVAPTSPVIEATEKVEPVIVQSTMTIAPTEIPDLPTETSIPEPTPTILPEGVLFRDDFENALQPGWTWENQNDQRWSITKDGKLQIIGESDNLLHDGWQSNLLWATLPAGDFNVDVHLIADPKVNFQQAAIFLFEDADNYVTINRGFCAPCGGSGIYMDYKISKDWGNYHKIIKETDVYLRLQSKEHVISGYYAIEPGKWIRLGRFGKYFEFKKVGLGVSNVGNESFDLIGQYDWFEINQAKK
jgi:hypothetical protein